MIQEERSCLEIRFVEEKNLITHVVDREKYHTENLTAQDRGLSRHVGKNEQNKGKDHDERCLPRDLPGDGKARHEEIGPRLAGLRRRLRTPWRRTGSPACCPSPSTRRPSSSRSRRGSGRAKRDTPG
ncbi:MAG: hypothetical protein MZU95_17520 [Desulfomicrobium escambiense]|nr:hypothetical protein [Desulfomicrobium escambiense]